MGESNVGQLGQSLPPLKPLKVTLFTMILYNSENSIEPYEAILSSIVLSQQCCDIYIICLTVAKP